MFDGFRSRCTTACAVRGLDRLAHGAEEARRSPREARHRAQYSVSGTPSTYSMTKYGVPSGSVSASYRRAMDGWTEVRERALLPREAVPPLR